MQRRRLAAFIAVAVTAVFTSALRADAASSTPTTFRDLAFTSSATTPSADKPQSKLWFNDGVWWGLLAPNTSDGVHIFELLANHIWRDTGAVVDNRITSTGDALWDGTRLYVGSRAAASGPRVNRLTYDPAARTYRVDAGFPVAIASGGTESLTIDKDTRGIVWATFTQSNKVWVTHSTPGNDGAWVTPFHPPVGDTTVSPDDISSIIAFNGSIGVMWSNQVSSGMRFATHRDGDTDTAWGPLEAARSGVRLADDHINLKFVATDPAGRLFAVTKTSRGDCSCDPTTDPLVELLVRARDGTWSHTTFGAVADVHTRPILLLDGSNRDVYVFATAPTSGGTIYYKKTSMDAPAFAPGRGTPFVTWPSASLNNATSTKQTVGPATGIVVLAADTAQRTYFHAELSLAVGPPPPPPPPTADTSPPTTPTGLRATASAHRVDLSWSPSSDNVGVTGYTVYRDGAAIGSASTTSFSDTTVALATTYSYAVDAVDAAGNRSARSAPVTVTTPATAAGIALVGATGASNPTATTLTIARPAGAAAGDVLVAAVAVRGNPALTAPAGWNLVRRDQATTTMGQAVWWHVMSGSEEPPSYTWTLSSAQGAAGAVLAYRGVDTAAPIAAAAGQTNAAVRTITAPSVDVPAGGEVVGLFGMATATTVTPPSGMVEQAEAASTSGSFKVTFETADALQAGAGPSGARAATAVASAVNVGQLLALRPA